MERDKPWWYPPPGPPYVVGRIDLGNNRAVQVIEERSRRRTGVWTLFADDCPSVDCHDDNDCEQAIRALAAQFPSQVSRVLILGPGHTRQMAV